MYFCNKCKHFTGVEDCSCEIPEERVWWKKQACKHFELREPVTVKKLQDILSKYAPSTVIVNGDSDICTDIRFTKDKELQIS